ncbi:hemolysin E [Vibrio paucivorans]
MNRFFVGIIALVTGMFALIFSLLMAIPLAIAALITGKRIQKQMKQQGYASPFEQPQQANVIEGECEEVRK